MSSLANCDRELMACVTKEGRPGLSSLIVPKVSVDEQQH